MIINDREIGPSHSPYIIAEISGNHNGSLEYAFRLIRAAKDAGADAVKFQAYTPDTITIDCDGPDFIVKEGPWKGSKLHQLYQTTHTPFEWFPALFGIARTLGITPFASVFDKSSVNMLEKLDCPAYKIASMEIVDLPLIEHVAKTGKPIIISTGMASYPEIMDAVNVANWKSPKGVGLLHCVSGYPTATSLAGIHRMPRLAEIYSFYTNVKNNIGISDHSIGDAIPIAATALGACIIEKHLMLGIEDTEDFEFSMDPIQFKMMVREVRNIWQAMQPPQGDPEQASRQLRRSLYVVQDIKAGEPFTEENVRSIRPAYGLPPKELPWVLTKVAAADLKRGMALQYDHIS